MSESEISKTMESNQTESYEASPDSRNEKMIKCESPVKSRTYKHFKTKEDKSLNSSFSSLKNKQKTGIQKNTNNVADVY